MWDWFFGFVLWVWDLFGDADTQNRVGAISAAVTAILAVLAIPAGVIWFFFKKLAATRKNAHTPSPPPVPLVPVKPNDGPALTVPEFIRLRREFKADLEQELAEASEAEKSELRARIAELESQIANPDAALEQARKRIADLEALLDRAGNQIGGDRIAEAKAALEQGDYSLADDIFAEIEARNDLAVQESARAAFGRGEVAEAEIRWHDAYDHYKRALDLHDTPDHLKAYARLCWRLAKGAEAVEANERLVAWAGEEHGEDSAEYATHLNNLAGAVQAQGRFEEAERLVRQALEIDRVTIGEGDPEYATDLNNLANVVQAQGRFEEAEGLFRQALAIDRVTIGEGHPDYAIHLNNLAEVERAQGRFEEAEGLFRQALKIARVTIGEGHPGYATDLNNLAAVVQAQGRFEEAVGLYRQALEIGGTTIGEGHPDYAIHLGNLGELLGRMGRVQEARDLLEQSLAIFRDTLPPEHPHIAEAARRLADLPAG